MFLPKVCHVNHVISFGMFPWADPDMMLWGINQSGKVWRFPKMRIPPKCRVYDGKSEISIWNGWFGATPIFGNLQIGWMQQIHTNTRNTMRLIVKTGRDSDVSCEFPTINRGDFLWQAFQTQALDFLLQLGCEKGYFIVSVVGTLWDS